MNVQLVPFGPEHYPAFVYIRSNLRTGDLYEFSCNGWRPEDVPDGVLWQSMPWCYLVTLNDEAVFVFGAMPIIPGVYQFWGFGTEKTPRVLPALTKFCREWFSSELFDSGVRRVQVLVPLQSQQSFQWLTEYIGMRVETIMSDYCTDGSPMAQLVFTRQDYRKYVSISDSPATAESCPACY